jgi:hypothetical protein
MTREEEQILFSMKKQVDKAFMKQWKDQEGDINKISIWLMTLWIMFRHHEAR